MLASQGSGAEAVIASVNGVPRNEAPLCVVDLVQLYTNETGAPLSQGAAKSSWPNELAKVVGITGQETEKGQF